MIQLSPEDHAASAALAAQMKAEWSKHPPKIAIAAVHMLTLEIAVQLANGSKKAALDYLKAMSHDGRDSIRRYFNAVEERKAKNAEAAKEALANGDAIPPHALSAHKTQESA